MHTLFPRHYHIFIKKAKTCAPAQTPQEAVEKEGHYGNDSGDYQTGESR